MSDFWNRVREALSAQGTTQEWVARKIGIRPDSFSRWIGRGILPSVDQGAAIASALGTTTEYLVTGKDPEGLSPRIHALAKSLSILSEDDLSDVEALVANKLSKYPHKDA